MRRLTALLLLLLTLWGAAAADSTLPWAVRHGDRESKRIAITVDDCGYIEQVRNIWALCQELGVKVTFFPAGRNLHEEDAELWREIAASPLAEIGSHSQRHYDWAKCIRFSVKEDMELFQQTLDRVLGYHYQTRSFRPPYGHCTTTRDGAKQHELIRIAAQCGYDHVILWDVSQTDPKKAVKDVKNGSILLYHANRKDYVCLTTLLPQLLEMGYEPVTVSELLGFDAPGPVEEDAPPVT